MSKALSLKSIPEEDHNESDPIVNNYGLLWHFVKTLGIRQYMPPLIQKGHGFDFA